MMLMIQFIKMKREVPVKNKGLMKRKVKVDGGEDIFQGGKR